MFQRNYLIWKRLFVLSFSVFLVACGVGNEQGFKEAVELNSKNIVEIRVESDNERVRVTETEAYTATGVNEDGEELDITSSVNWSSSDSSIASVNSEGIATGHENGTIDIIATLYDLSASKSLRSSDADLVSIAISGQPLSIPICQTSTQQLVATGTYGSEEGEDTAIITDKVTWSSASESVIYVGDEEPSSDGTRDAKGVLSALSEGSAVIVASQEGVDSPGVEVLVEESLLSITVNSENTEFYAEQAHQFSALGNYGSDPIDITENVEWTSTNTEVLSFSDSEAGQADLLIEGAANAFVTCAPGSESPVVSDALLVNVDEPVELSALQIEIDDVVYEEDRVIPLNLEDGSAQLELYLVYNNGDISTKDYADDEDTTWSEKENTSASISSTGLITFTEVGDFDFSVRYIDSDTGIKKDRDFTVEVE